MMCRPNRTMLVPPPVGIRVKASSPVVAELPQARSSVRIQERPARRWCVCSATAGFRGATAQDWARKLAPCSSCRVDFDYRRSALRGLRLGQREREVLLGAAHWETYVVTEAGMSRSLSAARRRAAQSLGKAGLVSAPTDDPTAQA